MKYLSSRDRRFNSAEEIATARHRELLLLDDDASSSSARQHFLLLLRSAVARLVVLLLAEMDPLPGSHCVVGSVCDGDEGERACQDEAEAFRDFRSRAGDAVGPYGDFLAKEVLSSFGLTPRTPLPSQLLDNITRCILTTY